jgi:ribosomal protein S12 methylthiotransferase
MYVADRLIDAIAGSEKIVPYIDMPLQHIHDEMLRRMARRVTRAQTEELLDKMRSRVDRLAIRTTFITGFPGETDEQFQTLAEFIERQRFERVGVFTYSLEPDTPAANLPGHLPEEVKNERRDRLMEIQQQVAFERNERLVGQQFDVLLDQPLPDQADVWIGRTYADAPDVDALVYVTGEGLSDGQIVPCEVVAFQEYDLVAAPVGDPR